ncbi:TPA: flagellar basal body rod protein FlgB [Vibrio vulnificus]|uniref:Flagellar basal body rod protein FlgB n=1 Tax=Vibrio vulnificus TaxID=672 RepID=A0A8H9N167_VIBVL|nr:flagellar basal body rod protein FlgB [Vibrio vulnificus]HAS8540935.1 flagellar basal body rod protein FlgB [Vibrio vulnificus]
MSDISSLSNYNQILAIREAQLALTASNIANQDTPNFKAKGISFQEAFRQASKGNVELVTDNSRHIKGEHINGGFNVQYVDTGTIKPDGNTVNEHFEKNQFAQQQVLYDAALRFSKASKNSIIKSLKVQQ